MTPQQAMARSQELTRQIVYVDHDLIEDFLALAVEWRMLARELAEGTVDP